MVVELRLWWWSFVCGGGASLVVVELRFWWGASFLVGSFTCGGGASLQLHLWLEALLCGPYGGLLLLRCVVGCCCFVVWWAAASLCGGLLVVFFAGVFQCQKQREPHQGAFREAHQGALRGTYRKKCSGHCDSKQEIASCHMRLLMHPHSCSLGCTGMHTQAPRLWQTRRTPGQAVEFSVPNETTQGAESTS